MPPPATSDPIAALVARLPGGDRRALARLLTLAENPDHRTALAGLLTDPPARRAPVIGLTGPAGVGKSSLLGALVSHLLAQGRRIGVLACDPESPLTGGALLGDRCRIVGPDAAPNLFL